jgi:ribonuclease E
VGGHPDQGRQGRRPGAAARRADLVIRVVRDVFNEDFNRLVVQGDSEWATIRDYVEFVAPELAPRLSRHTSDKDVFAEHRVDEQLLKALDRKVYLPSGGSLVIDRTEAMVVIDVNTGKFVGKGGNLEETVTRNNLEAAEEIAGSCGCATSAGSSSSTSSTWCWRATATWSYDASSSAWAATGPSTRSPR